MPIPVYNTSTSAPNNAVPANNEKKVEPINVSTPLTGRTPSSEAPSGLTATELSDPNEIKVTIADQDTPIVILYGPPSCGKTMTLVRMTRYLVNQGYTVVPDKTFRPTYDENYKKLCETFDQMINSDSAASSTSNISFMLVKVLWDGNPVCQILEAPGEYYFYPDDPKRDYPTYVHTIINGPNRKVWAIMVEPDWSDAEPRANYVRRIHNLKSSMSPRDKVLFIYNKIDLTPYVISAGRVNTKEAEKNVQNLYQGIFTPFMNQNPITKWFRKFNCRFVPFQTGSYSKTMIGGLTYIEGPDAYARQLWNSMLKFIKG
jgi:DNA polymerase III delta prime subunit